jgi:uncharacterized protein
VAIFDKAGLLVHLRNQFAIDWNGHHGISHWTRVRANGLMLAPETGANTHVIELFAFFHDSRRFNEHVDDGHGSRGAVLARQLEGRFFDATDTEMDLLQLACDGHSDGMTTGDVTVLTCWDADRLDLGRVGITPNPKYLCTDAAKNLRTLERAHARALAWVNR